MTIEAKIDETNRLLAQVLAVLNANSEVGSGSSKPVVDHGGSEDLSYAQKRKAEIAAEAKAKKDADAKAEADAKAAAKAEKEANRIKQEELRAVEAAAKAAAALDEADDFLEADEPKITLDQVREVMIKLRTQNKDLAFKVLSEAGAGASLLPGSKAINDKTPGNAVLKVENFAAVFEAATKALK